MRVSDARAHASSSQLQAAAGTSMRVSDAQAHAPSSQRQAAAGASMRVSDALVHASSSQRQAAEGASMRVSDAQPRSSYIGGGVQAALPPSAALTLVRKELQTNRAPSAIPALDVFMRTGNGDQTEGQEAAAPAPAVMHGSRPRSPVSAVSPGPGMQRVQTGSGRAQALGASAGGLAPGLSAEQQAPKVRCFVQITDYAVAFSRNVSVSLCAVFVALLCCSCWGRDDVHTSLMDTRFLEPCISQLCPRMSVFHRMQSSIACRLSDRQITVTSCCLLEDDSFVKATSSNRAKRIAGTHGGT